MTLSVSPWESTWLSVFFFVIALALLVAWAIPFFWEEWRVSAQLRETRNAIADDRPPCAALRAENKALRERLAATNSRIGQLKEHSKGIVQGSSHLAIANAILAEHEPEMAALKSREKADDALCRACALASIIKQQAERLSLLFPTETQEANE